MRRELVEGVGVAGTGEVIVVGAGLAGLACARRLAAAGVAVQVVEAADAVGGRVRTDRVDGFLVDRGFQVLSTAYPEAVRLLDYDALDLACFDRAVELYTTERRRFRLSDPRTDLTGGLAYVQAPIGSVGDKAAVAAYFALAALLPDRLLTAGPDTAAEEAWRSRGISQTMIDQLLRPFFAGVVLEPEVTTSRRFVDLMVRMFVRGRSAVPARGMQQIPEQLAAALPAGSVHLNTVVREVTADRVITDDGDWTGDKIVLATDVTTAARLAPAARMEPGWKGVSTVYHVADEPPTDRATLLLDTDPASPVNTSVVITAAAPHYSPDRRALIATSLIDTGRPTPDEATVRLRLAALWGTSTSRWEHLVTHDVPHALPAMPAPHPFRRPVRIPLSGGMGYVCGDHRDTSSIQGALVSGRRAADAVLPDLGRSLTDRTS